MPSAQASPNPASPRLIPVRGKKQPAPRRPAGLVSPHTEQEQCVWPRGRAWKLGPMGPRAFGFREDGAHWEMMPRGRARVLARSFGTAWGRAEGCSWTWRFPGLGLLEWRIGCLPGVRGWMFDTLFCNLSGGELRVEGLTHLRTGPRGLAFQGEASAWHVGMIGHGPKLGSLAETLPSRKAVEQAMWASYNRPAPNPLPETPRTTDGRWREMMDFLAIYRQDGAGMMLGPAGPPRSDLVHELFVEPGAVLLESTAEMNGCPLAPGAWCQGQAMAWVAEPYETAASVLLDGAARTHGSRVHRGPRSGWCSWYDRNKGIDLAHSSQVAGALEGLRPRLKLDVFQLDDGFQRQVGDWRANEKFPGGLAEFVSASRRAGCEPGIWMAPLAVHESLGWHLEHPEWFQRRADGSFATRAGNWGGASYFLDPTHPESAARIAAMVRAARAEGFTYFKIDFNDLARDCRYHSGVTRLAAYRGLYSLYRRELGEEVYLLACSGFTRGVLGYADAARIGPDSVAKWRRIPPFNLKEAIRATGMTAAANRRWFANDPDVAYLKVDHPECRLHQWRVWHGFVGLLGGLVMTSARFFDLPELADGPERLRNFQVIVPPVREAGRSYRAGYDLEHSLFGIEVDRPWGRHHAVQVWNPDPARKQRVRLDRSELGLAPGPVVVWSFWEGAVLGVWRGAGFAVEQEPEHAAVLRLTPLPPDGLPRIVGSTLHIGMGSVEWDAVHTTNGRLGIAFSQAGAEEGVLAVSAPGVPRVRACRGLEARVGRECKEGIWLIHVRRSLDQPAALELEFE